MLVEKVVKIDGKEYIERYSDDGHMVIRNDGVCFDDAIDLPEAEYTYTESTEYTEEMKEKMKAIEEVKAAAEEILNQIQ